MTVLIDLFCTLCVIFALVTALAGYSSVVYLTGVADSSLTTTMSNGKYDGGRDGTSCRYTDHGLVNGGPPAEYDDERSWCGKFDVKSLLQDAPVDSIRQRTHVEREELSLIHI